MKYYVYIHRRKSDDKIFYVGKGTGKRINSSQQRNQWWHNVVNKHGFYGEIKQSFNSEDQAFAYEETLIKALSSTEKLVNLKSGGKGGVGFNHTGYSKQKISDALRNRVWKQESKDKISKALTGSTFSRKRKGKFPSNNRKKLICLELNKVFNSTHEAAQTLKLNYSNIAAVCRGERFRCGGYTFKYV